MYYETYKEWLTDQRKALSAEQTARSKMINSGMDAKKHQRAKNAYDKAVLARETIEKAKPGSDNRRPLRVI